jgi:hypothetical protein
VVAHGFHAVTAGLAAEAAVAGHAEVGHMRRRGRLAPAQPGDAVHRQDDAEVDARVPGLEVGQRPEEGMVLAAQVGGDGVVDAGPGVPVQFGDAGAEPEDRGLVGVARDAGGRRGFLDGLDVGMAGTCAALTDPWAPAGPRIALAGLPVADLSWRACRSR